MTELKKRISSITVVGKAKIKDTTFSGETTSPTTGFKYCNINLGIETSEGNVIYGKMMGGYSPKKPVLYGMDKDSNQMLINWNDRFNEKIIDSSADFKLHKIGVEKDDNDKTIIKRFLSPLDVHDYLQKHLKDGMMVCVKGEYEFSEYNGNDKREFKIKDIYLSNQEEGFANFRQTILLDEYAISKEALKASKESGEVVIQAKVAQYVGKRDGKEFKKTIPFSLPVVVKVNQENPEMTQKVLNALFKVKKGKIRELTIEGQIIEGFEKQEISIKDIKISPEVRELIDMGLYDEEEALKKMTVQGNKTRKLVFAKPFLKKDANDETKLVIDLDDTKYTPADLVVPEPEGKAEEKKDEIDLNKIAEDASNEKPVDIQNDDMGWMTAMGLGS
ncbi:hypothetical protein [Bacillus cereus]|uniref:hypothetical protein n=1 Tax=Bacillus cereus TaxID=1396 RepID=UPI0023EE64F7|nr:hypothetical protein [Bacillus sp. S0628]